ncbi:MAG: metallophosphoesterase, partial [Lachnospiraceae bacterium]|nr:metallophosphoesterase [Lachnospiraceae bacterium]
MQLFKTAHISEKSHSRKPKRILLFIFLLLFLTGALYVTIGYIDGQRIEISHYAIEAPSESPVRILQISDLHCAEFGNNNSNLISKISSLNPDIIFITGDMLNADNSDIHVALQLVKTLVTIAPVYYSYGNHETAWESSFNTNLRAELELLGAVVLDKNYVDIDLKGLPVRIGGYMGYYRSWGMLTTDSDQITQSIAFADAFENTQRYRILLNHIPTAWVDWNHGDDYD